MHYSFLCSKILIKKGNIWTNRPVHGPLACYKRSYRILLFIHPKMVLADGWTTIETPQPWCQKGGRPHHPTWTPPPLLIWAEGNHILVPESQQTIHLHPIIPHVSIVSRQFPRLEAFQNTCLGSGDHYPGLIIIFLFFPSVYRSIKVWF